MSSEKEPLEQDKFALTDSPWLWLLLFSSAALIATFLLIPKFGARQSQVERQFQGRQYSQLDEANKPAKNQIEYSTPANTMFSLWPLRILALVGIVLAYTGLQRDRQKHSAQSTADRQPPDYQQQDSPEDRSEASS